MQTLVMEILHLLRKNAVGLLGSMYDSSAWACWVVLLLGLSLVATDGDA